MEEDAAARALFVPIVSGSIAFWLGKKGGVAGQEHTHKWTVYLRHANDFDLTYAVARVEFTLHPSFANHVRGAWRGVRACGGGGSVCRRPHRHTTPTGRQLAS